MSAFDEAAKQALSDAGAQCGDCGDQPGDRICPDCERCYGWYVAALRKAGWVPRAEVLNEAADELDAHCEKYGVLGVGDRLRRMAAAAPVPVKTAGDETASRPVADATTCPHCSYTTTHCGQCGEDMTEVPS